MSDLRIEEAIEITPDDVEAPPAQEFCHILDASEVTFYCGKPDTEGAPTCQIYKGEAICPSCGLATCPSCAVNASLEDRLVD